MWTDDNEIIVNGRMKWRAKKRVSVGSLIEKPPHSQVVREVPR